MLLFHILGVIFSFNLCECKSAEALKAHYTTQTFGKTTSGGKFMECGVKYLDEQFGVFKVNEDGTECTTEPWPWFDTQATVTGYTYYKKRRMTLTLNVFLYFKFDAVGPVDYYMVQFPSPMSTNNIMEVYFTPKIPFGNIVFDLHGDERLDIINRMEVSSTNVSMTSIMTNGQANPNPNIIHDNVTFVEERMYKVTFKATESTLQLFVDDQLLLTSDDSREPTDIKYLTNYVYQSASSEAPFDVRLHKIDFFMN